jgi:serine protease
MALLMMFILVGCGGGSSDGDTDDVTHGPEPTPVTFTLRGSIQAANGSAIDGDVNDPLAPFTANNQPSTAQLIPNPVTLGGYANQPGTGPSGALQVTGDVRDWYRISLVAGQSVALFIAGNGRTDDLDLALFDSTGTTLLDASLSQNRTESLTINRADEYLLLVEAFRGASNYVLIVGQTPPPADAGLRLSDSFVAGEIIARFRSDRAPLGVGLAARGAAVGLTAKGGAEGRNMLLTLKGVQRGITYQALDLTNSTVGSALQTTDPELQLKLDTLRAIKAMNLRDDITAAAPNYLRQASLVPNDALYSAQWHYPLLSLPQAWDLNTGSGVIVAVIDTGVVLNHPDLQGQVIGGYDFISNPQNANDDDGIDLNADDPGDNADPDGGGSFHGTHVAGTVAAATNNRQGVAGVAFDARIMPLRVLGRFGGSDFDIEQALRFAAGLPNDSGTLPPRCADVANLSLEGPNFSGTFQTAIDEIRATGMMLVAAAGNRSSRESAYPASYEGVVSVSAVGISKELAPYSNFGAFVDVAAPGGNTAQDSNGDGQPDGVLSTLATGARDAITTGFGILQGTSMATSHVSGIIALMRAANPDLTPQDIDNLLASGSITEDLGIPGRDDRFGHGLLNAYQAVTEAINASSGVPVQPQPILTISPTSLNFGVGRTQFIVTVANGGGGTLTVNPPTENAGGWLSITPPTDSNGLGNYLVTVNRNDLDDGVYTATITFNSNAGNVQVPVIMQVSNNLGPGDMGQLYVVIFDVETAQAITSVTAAALGNGRYTYQLTDIPAGTYEVFAGTDLNNDGIICDPGEACGAYLTLDEPANLVVNSDRAGLDFTTSFADNLAAIGVSRSEAGENTRMPTLLRRRDDKGLAK